MINKAITFPCIRMNFQPFVINHVGVLFSRPCLLLLVMTMMLLSSCEKEEDTIAEIPRLQDENAEIALKWADMSLYTIRFSALNTPTYASRSLGYLGLAMYEAIVPGDPAYRSMNGQLNGLTLAAPEPGKDYHWLIALNAGQETLLKLLYPVPENSHRYIHEKIDSLSNAVYKEKSKDIPRDIIVRSIKWGEDVAMAIYEWSKTDGGHQAYTYSIVFPNFNFPSGPSYWVPPVNGQIMVFFPMHPEWGDNRRFVPENSSMPVPEILFYSTNPASEYYQQYKAVYDKDKTLTLAEKEIAAWWGDDPTETFSPPGHSYHLASIAIKKSDAPIIKAAEAYAKTGMAVADAFVNCWQAKFTYFNERPSTFVKANIDPEWEQFWPEPPFPSFPSGHSTQIAAAAEVLTDVFGDNFSFTDKVHEGFRRYDSKRFLDMVYPARSFNSFWEAANECAYSRILGGIHTEQDNVVGIEEGKKIGQHVNALQWKN